MKKICFYLSTLLLAATLVSCAGRLSEIPADHVQTDPQVLELRGGTVDALVTTRFPERFFPRRAVLTVTPVLVADDGRELFGTPVTYQGERVQGNNRVIPFREGAVVTQNVSFPFEEGFERATLHLDFNLVTGNREQRLPRVRIADGVNTTSALVARKNLTPMLGADAFQQVIEETIEAEIRFIIQQANIRPSELRTQDVVDLTARMREAVREEGQSITSARVEAFASPDGPEDLNYRLARQRASNTVAHLNRDLRRANVNVESRFTAEDWDGFQRLVAASNIADRQLILNVLSAHTDPVRREAEIRRMVPVFQELADDILPQLRRSRMMVTIEVVGKSDEEILELLRNDVAALSVEELLYAATLIETTEERAAVYQLVIDNFPDDFRGYNNLGTIKFATGDIDAAAPLLQRAFEISDNGVTNYNLALLALQNGDYERASTLLAQAQARGGVDARYLTEARAVVSIYRGNFAEANSALGDIRTNTSALSQILINDYASATETLNSIQNPDATTYYLRAVVGARTNDLVKVIDNLRTAIARDASLADRARRDVEFARFFIIPDFQAIVR